MNYVASKQPELLEIDVDGYNNAGRLLVCNASGSVPVAGST